MNGDSSIVEQLAGEAQKASVNGSSIPVNKFRTYLILKKKAWRSAPCTSVESIEGACTAQPS